MSESDDAGTGDDRPAPPVGGWTADAAITHVIETELGEHVDTTAPLGGGDVAQARRVHVSDGRRVFAKFHASPPEGFFTTEATGLRWLGDALAADGTGAGAEAGASAPVGVPSVVAVSDDPAVLVLEWIDEGPGTAGQGSSGQGSSRAGGTDEALGRGLAVLHRAGAPCFGREDRRTTGSRGLPNEPCDTWAEFYATQRLIPLARLARDGGALEASTVRAVDRVTDRLDDLGGPIEAPARLHGDLWAGNRLVDRTGRNWLVDPAAHGGHREFDLAMMRLFGGYGPDAFAAYDAAFPLADGWNERVPLHQLAPLIVHAVKFGGGYVRGVERALGALR